MEEIIKPYGYIYLTTNLANGKGYIGKHSVPYHDPNYIGSGGKHFWNAVNKYGRENFINEVLCWCFSQEELDDEEEFLIDFFDCVESDDFYNEREGGKGGWGKGRNHAHYGISNKGTWLGKKFSDTHRANLSKSVSAARTGTKLSESAKAKLSERNSGEGNPFYGKKHSEATKQHLSEVRKGMTHTYHFTCTECGEQKIGTGSRQHICSDCRANIEESRRSKIYKKQYRVICKHCGRIFLGNSPKSNACNDCKERK